jgi:hypothetical protein
MTQIAGAQGPQSAAAPSRSEIGASPQRRRAPSPARSDAAEAEVIPAGTQARSEDLSADHFERTRSHLSATRPSQARLVSPSRTISSPAQAPVVDPRKMDRLVRKLASPHPYSNYENSIADKKLKLECSQAPATRKKLRADIERLSGAITTNLQADQRALNKLLKQDPQTRSALLERVTKRVTQVPSNDKNTNHEALLKILKDHSESHYRRAHFGRAATDLQKGGPTEREAAQAKLKSGLAGSSTDQTVAADALFRAGKKGVPGAVDLLSESVSPKAWDRIADLAGEERPHAATNALEKGSEHALAAITRGWDQANDQAKDKFKRTLSTPQTIEAMKEGSVPGLAQTVGLSLARDKKLSGIFDKRLDALVKADTPQARDELIKLSQHQNHGRHAGRALARTKTGIKAATKAFNQSDDSNQIQALSQAVLSSSNLKNKEGKWALSQALNSKNETKRRLALQAGEHTLLQPETNPKMARSLFSAALRGMSSNDEKMRSVAKNIIGKANHLPISRKEKLDAYGRLRTLAADSETAAAREDAKVASKNLASTMHDYGRRSQALETAARAGDVHNFSKELEEATPNQVAMLDAALKSEGGLMGHLDKLRKNDQSGYEKTLDSLNEAAARDDDKRSIRDRLGRALAKHSGDGAIARFAERNINVSSRREGYAKSRTAIEILGTIASPDAVNALIRANGKADAQRGQINAALGDVLVRPDVDAKSKSGAAHAMLKNPSTWWDKDTRHQLVSYAAESKDIDLKRKALEIVPKGPLSDERLGRITTTYGGLYSEALGNAKEGTRLNSLRSLYRARGLAQHEDYAERVNLDAINRDILRLESEEPVASRLKALKQQAVKKTLGEDPGKSQRDYLASDDFQQRLRLLPKDERPQMIKKQLSMLTMIDPQGAENAAAAFAQKSFETNGLRAFNQLKPERAKSALRATIDRLVADATQSDPNDTRISDAMSSDFVEKWTTMSEEAKDRELTATRKLLSVAKGGSASKALALARRTHLLAEGNRSILPKFIVAADKRGVFGSMIGIASVVSLAASDKPMTQEDWQNAARSTLTTLGSSADTGRLFDIGKLRQWNKSVSLGTNFSQLTKAGRVAKAMEFLGPPADIVGAVMDYQGMKADWAVGDTGGAIAKGTGAVFGAGSAVAGLCIAAGASGPLAPAVLLVGAVGGLLAWGADELFGESDGESFLRRGVQVDGRSQDYWQ